MSGKIKIGATISPLTLRRLNEMVEGQETFSSRSDAVEKSLDMMYFDWKHSVRLKNYDHNSVAIKV